MNEYLESVTCGSCNTVLGRGYEWPHFCVTAEGAPIILTSPWEHPWEVDGVES